MPNGVKIEYSLHFGFRTSNNEAEYEALLVGLWLARTKDVSMSTYLLAAHLQLRKFCAYKIWQIPRIENSHDDALARLVSAINNKIGQQAPVEILTQPSTIGANVCDVQYENTWLSPIYLYLTNGTIPDHKTQARKL
ncbi:unnamed protein product [Prunus armeniaca]